MDIRIKKVSEGEKWDVVVFLANEKEKLLIELNPGVKICYEGMAAKYSRNMDRDDLSRDMGINSTIYAAYNEEDEVVGAGFINSDGYLHSLYVKEEYQNKTVGSQLLEHLIEACNNFKIIRVDARVTHINLYERFSFQIMDGERNEAFVPMRLERSYYGK